MALQRIPLRCLRSAVPSGAHVRNAVSLSSTAVCSDHQEDFAAQLPVVNGSHVTFPDMGNDANMTMAMLKKFEVCDRVQRASSRLLNNVEFRVQLAKRRPSGTKWVSPQVSSAALTQNFGTATNAVVLILQFARVAHEMSLCETSDGRIQVVANVVRDILGCDECNFRQVCNIEAAIHTAQSADMCTKVYVTQSGCAIPSIVMYMCHENLWQNLNEWQRRLISSTRLWLDTDKMTSDGLAEGVSAFHTLWESLDEDLRYAAMKRLHSQYSELESRFADHFGTQELVHMSR